MVGYLIKDKDGTNVFSILKENTLMMVLDYVLKQEENIVVLNDNSLKELAKDNGISVRAIRYQLRKLVDLNILENLSRGCYNINKDLIEKI